ncbi:MAG: DUF4345 domain-containing protein [Bacteroidota bacterium]
MQTNSLIDANPVVSTTRSTAIFLFVAGVLLLAIGIGILFTPHAFHASNGIFLGADPNLLSELRAPGGLLLGSALIILAGAFRTKLRSQAVDLTILVYGTFGLARLVGFLLDGIPASGIVAATIIELVVASIGLLFFRQQS